MRIHQFHPSFSPSDGICNSMLEIQKLCLENGFNSNIFAQFIHPKLRKNAFVYNKIAKKLGSKDVLLIHYSIGSPLFKTIIELPVKKILIYHNVTNPKFFEGIDSELYINTTRGLQELRAFADKVDHAFADSTYNKQDLENKGFKNVKVTPLIVDFDKYNLKPDKKVINKFNDNWKNIIFVGRIAPHKKQEDVIKSFYVYKTFLNPKSRLFIVGLAVDTYIEALKKLVKDLKLEDVFFPGHISFNELLSYYHLADCFVCMSEHEGFCVPLLESMYFEIPIIAFHSTAVPETLGSSGILLKDKDYLLIAELVNNLCTNEELQKEVVSNQNKRLKDFDKKMTKAIFLKNLKEIIQ